MPGFAGDRLVLQKLGRFVAKTL